jgi:hypothetical protein
MATQRELSRAYSAGYTSGRRLVSRRENPYAGNDTLADSWDDGYTAGAAETEARKAGR